MPNVQQILTASYDKTVKIWDVPSQSPIISFEGHEVTHMLIQANYFTNLFI
jgi:WD40 repeat protein